MEEITYIDRLSKQIKKEKVYGYFFLNLAYGKGFFSKFFGCTILPCIAYIPFFSWLYGCLQKTSLSRFKIGSFIRTFSVDVSEFLDPLDSFGSFNDFFVRRLKPSARPIACGDNVAILPADGRYLVFQDISGIDGFLVKGHKFSLDKLLLDPLLSRRYSNGSMVIARLCPTDYHRFHFPCQGVAGLTRKINGPLFSVNPIALKKNIHFLTENRRVITSLDSPHFGTILYIEVGATYVGRIHQTYIPGSSVAKGDEKGYFSFGGSCIILLFEAGKIVFDADLLEASLQKMETLGLFGQSLGIAPIN